MLKSYRIDYLKKSVTLKVPKDMLDMDQEMVKQYHKLAKMSQESKVKKMVEALCNKGSKKPRKSSMSLQSKKFFPKTMKEEIKKVVKGKSGSFDAVSPAQISEISVSA